MALNITRGNDPIMIPTIAMIIYGDPGIGKTSMGFTAGRPLLLDFDQGAHRAANRKDIVRINDWAQVEGMTLEDLADYDTIILDTVGRALDCLTRALIQDDPKLAKRTGELTLPGYGALKGSFVKWMDRVRGYGKDIVMIAHKKEDKKGDDLIFRPDVQGGSYGEIFKLADTIGYIHAADKAPHGVVEYDPNVAFHAKNPARLPSPLVIPDFTKDPDFLGKQLPAIKLALQELHEGSRKAFAQVQEYRSMVEGCDTPKKLNDIIVSFRKEPDMPEAVKAQVKVAISQQARSLGLTPNPNKGDGEPFYVVAGAAPAEPQQQSSGQEAGQGGAQSKKPASKRKAAA